MDKKLHVKSLRFPEELFEAIKFLALSDERSVNSWMIKALKAQVASKGRKARSSVVKAKAPKV